MRVTRGMHGELPFAALGTGRPLIALAGLTPVAGIGGDAAVRMLVPGLTRLARWRRLTFYNRRRGLPEHMTIEDLAAEHADALRSAFDQPVDLLGFSTGGSIAQQLAADHPDVVRRLVLVSTACRLDGEGKAAQAAIARHLRAGRRDRAAAVAVAAALPVGGSLPIVPAAASAASSYLIPTLQDAADLATTIEAEDRFDLAHCPPVVAPTLILAGSRDRFYPQSLFQETHALIEKSELHVLRRRGHASVLAGFRGTDLIRDFLS